MITDKIKALFQFIEFLNSNIENFKQYDEVLDELHLLDNERQKLRPQKNFADKLKYDEVQAKIKDKIKVIQENIIHKLQAKANELNICDPNLPETIWSWNISEMQNLKENFSLEDIPEILKQKSKYLEYRTVTNSTYFQNEFFDQLDETLKELFDYFKDTEQNEFEAFETKAIQVNDIGEAVKLFQQGHKKFTLPNSFLNPSTIQQQPNIEPLPPQQFTNQKPELKIDQIAIKYAYEGLQITRENGNEIAKEYGHNSGEKLFQRFTYFSSSANRKGKPNLCTPKKLDNKIKLIESVIELLPTDKQERAKDEVSILKKIYEAEYL